MNDLISRKALIEEIEKNKLFAREPATKKCIDAINSQPTAYDVDAVVQQIEKKIFSADLYGDGWDGQTVDNLLCFGDIYDMLKAGGKDE